MSETKYFYTQGASVKLTVFSEGDTIAILSDLYSSYPRKGSAKKVMRQLIEHADRLGLVVTLTVQRYRNPNGELDDEALEEFYTKFGFVRMPNCERPYRMIRRPQSQESQAS